MSVTNIRIQRHINPVSEFLSEHNIPEVYENDIRVELKSRMPSGDNTTSVNDDDYVVGPQTLTLDLWSDMPNTNLVYGLKEQSMRLFQDDQEAINVHHMNVMEKFCYAQVQLKPIDEQQSDIMDGQEWFNLGKNLVITYTIPEVTRHMTIEFVLVTSKPINNDLIAYNGAAAANVEMVGPTEDRIEQNLLIAESHILPFSMVPAAPMGLLHADIDSTANAGRLYDYNPKRNVKFNYSCAELYYEGFFKAQSKKNMLEESKHYYIIGTNFMTGKKYGTIMIGIDKTKSLRDVKLKIIEYIKEASGESISEKNFELYRINERPINPAKPLMEIGNVMILKMKSA